uniref:hypothetical protein n=1 Tax=Microvirga roseola TaxID=2883126 RepID=UPI00389916BF
MLKRQGYPLQRVITEKLGSYAAARRHIMPAVEHRLYRCPNNRRRIRTCPCAGMSGQCRFFLTWWPAAARQRALCRPQSVRSTLLRPLCSRHPSAPLQCRDGVGVCSLRCRVSPSADRTLSEPNAS